MAEHILNCAFHILNMSCPCYWSVIPLFVSIGRWILAIYIMKMARLVTMRIQSLQVNLPSTIYIVKMVSWSLMCVLDVAGNSTIYYPHHEGA
jgi:hypothetical protein